MPFVLLRGSIPEPSLKSGDLPLDDFEGVILKLSLEAEEDVVGLMSINEGSAAKFSAAIFRATFSTRVDRMRECCRCDEKISEAKKC